MAVEPPDILDLGVPEHLAAEARYLCDCKVRLDLESRKPYLQELQNDWVGYENTCAFFPGSFLRVVVPFLNWSGSNGECFKAMVDSRHVLGACIKGKPHHIAEQDVPSRIRGYSTHHDDTRRDASYWWYQPLGLLVANEGKHRVAFMRAHGNLPIAASVTPWAYPSPERIRLIEPARPGDLWLALLDGRYVQVVRRPSVTKRFLGAYGVMTVRWSQLEGLPSEHQVRMQIESLRLHMNHEGGEQERTFDLMENRKAKTGRDRPAQRITAAASEIDGYDFDLFGFLRWPVAFGASGLGVLGVARFAEVPLLWSASSALLGAAVAMSIAPSVMRWRRWRGTAPPAEPARRHT